MSDEIADFIGYVCLGFVALFLIITLPLTGPLYLLGRLTSRGSGARGWSQLIK